MRTDAIFETARAWVDDNTHEISSLIDRIWDYAEPSFLEMKSAKALCDLMAANGFSIETGMAHMPSSFVATYGQGRPRIGVMCEYDATPGESQAAVSYPHAQPGRFSGFTDLHNGIGVGGAAAAVAVAKAMSAHGVKGSVVALGTPAEKLCAGKPLMAQAGVFDGFDAIIAWHPRPYSTVEWDTGPSMQRGEIFHFIGKSAYSARPWTGVSAIDAAVLTHVILQFLKDHMPPEDRSTVAEIITRGGDHVTSIPGSTQSWFVLRAATPEAMLRTSAMLSRAVEAACLAVGCTFERRIFSAVRPWLPNHAIGDLCYRNLERAGPPKFSAEAKIFAADVLKNLGAPPDPEPYDETLTDPRAGVTIDFAYGTDDVNEFCWHAPTARIYVAHGLRTTSIANWARGAFCRSETSTPTVASAARAVAFSVLDLMTDPVALEAARTEHVERIDAAGRPGPLIPAGTRPPIEPDFAPRFVLEHQLNELRKERAG